MVRRRDAEQFDEGAAPLTISGPLLLVGVVCLLLIVGGLWISRQGARTPGVAGPTIRIATWNMHVFAPRPAIRLQTIADIIRTSNFDIVAMQEIREDGQEVDALLRTLGPPWIRSPFSGMTGNHERFVFIFNGDHVREIGPAKSIDAAGEFSRLPFEDEFQAGQFAFTLITCHLYYGEGAAGHERRSREAHTLADYAMNEVTARHLPDVIVLGDFNEMNGLDGNLHFFRANGWESLVTDPTNLHGSETYDNLLIDPRQTHAWTGSSGSIHFEQTLFDGNDKLAVESVSDHRPAYADFSTAHE